ncbi:hypothetical protein CspeluHIS016_0105130 [Cutaneotrichosporon spelunceum]|uniref:Uncharacterized protein n=1 Tax=Cutaneotrichosporon spelunceum TaxID=1672016 RepID=A0AAD3TNP1_9TREE|nr:hypothetical protein CspeluHIS016_0105130 [Cutaneotrichosporon spelunceum]
MDTLRPPQSTPSLTSLTSSDSSSMQSHGRASPVFETPAPLRPSRDATTPADRLRNLLDMMNGEMRAARPTPSYRRADKDATPRVRAEPTPIPKEESEDSPPSPPPRIHYARPRRDAAPPASSTAPVPEEEASPPRRFAALPKRASPPRRLTSRAVALRAAAAAADEQEALQSILPREVRKKSTPTPLENFIASAAPPTPYEPRRRPSVSEEPLRHRLSVSEATPHARPRASTPPDSPPRPPHSPSPPPSATPPQQPSPPQRRQLPPSPKNEEPAYKEPEEPEPPRRRGRWIATPPNSSDSFAAGLEELREPVHDLEESELRWRDESVESSDSSVPIDLNRGPTARLIVAEELSMSRSRKSLSNEGSPTTSRSFTTAERSPTASQTFATAERSPSAPRSFATARSQTASMTFATAPHLPTASPSFATAPGPSPGRRFERSPKQRSLERSPKEQHGRRSSADTSLPAFPVPESSDDDEENSALVARRKMFRSSKSREPQPEEPARSRTRRLSASQRSESSADARYAALKASMGVDSESDDSNMRPEPSRQDSSLLGSLWKGLPPGLQDDSSLDMRNRPSLAELSTRLDSTLITSAIPHNSTRRYERSEEYESTRRFEPSEEHQSPRQAEVSEDNGSTRRYERAEEHDISVARSDFEDLGGLPQSSPPRPSPGQSLRQSLGKPLLSLRQSQLDWQDDETAERRPEFEVPESEGPTDDLEWRPPGPDTTSDSWLELNAAAALNPPTPEASRSSPPLVSPVRVDSDTLPDTPPRQRPGIHRTLLRAATTPTRPPEQPMPTPLRSALKGGRFVSRFEARFESHFALASPSVRWSPDVLDNEPAVEEEAVADGVTEPEQQERASTSPPSSPPAHLSTPEDLSTPVRAPATSTRTPRPPGAWGTPLPPQGVPPTTPLPAPPVSSLPAASQQGMFATPPSAVPATPGLPTPRPPGAWFSPGRYVPPRMSRLRNEVRLDESASSTGSEMSVHRLAFSPKRRRTGAASSKSAHVLLPAMQAPPAGAEQSAKPGTEEAEAETKPETGEPAVPGEPSTPRPQTRSPATSPPAVELRTPHPPGAMPKDEPEDGDTSWTARIKRAFTPANPSTPVTPRTASRTRLAEAQDALDTASRASAKARSRVSAAQDAWRAAVASKSTVPEPEPAPAPEAKPEPKPEPEPEQPERRRVVWLLWAVVEMLVLWAVFRVTLEYTASPSFLARRDPLGPFGGYAVGVRLPAALEAFGKHPHRSANVFDLLHALGLGLEGTMRRWVPT